jgi:hypothetical protein
MQRVSRGATRRAAGLEGRGREAPRRVRARNSGQRHASGHFTLLLRAPVEQTFAES